MSTIDGSNSLSNFIQQTFTSQTNAVQSTTNTQSSGTAGVSSSDYASLPFRRTSLSNLGLNPPLSSGDSAMLLAQVSLALEVIFGANENERVSGQMAASRFLRAGMFNFNDLVDGANAAIAKATKDKEEAQQQITQKNGELNTARGNVNSAKAVVTDLEKKVDTAYKTYLNAVNDKKPDQKKIDEAYASYSNLNGSLATARTTLSGHESTVTRLTGEIAQLQAKVNEAQSTIDTNTVLLREVKGFLAMLTQQLAELTTRLQPDKIQMNPDRERLINKAFEDLHEALNESENLLLAQQLARAQKDRAESTDKTIAHIGERLIGIILAIADLAVIMREEIRAALSGKPSDVDEGAMRHGSRMRVPA